MDSNDTPDKIPPSLSRDFRLLVAGYAVKLLLAILPQPERGEFHAALQPVLARSLERDSPLEDRYRD